MGDKWDDEAQEILDAISLDESASRILHGTKKERERWHRLIASALRAAAAEERERITNYLDNEAVSLRYAAQQEPTSGAITIVQAKLYASADTLADVARRIRAHSESDETRKA